MNKRNHSQYLNTMVNDTISRKDELFSHLELNLQSWTIVHMHDSLFDKTNTIHGQMVKAVSSEIIITCPKRYGSYDQSSSSCNKCRSGRLYKGCEFCNKKQGCAGFDDLNGQPSCCNCFKNSPNYKRDNETI